MRAKELIKLNDQDGLWTEIATDYGKKKNAYSQAIGVIHNAIKDSFENGGTGEEYREYYDRISCANAICELSGIDPHYLEKEVDEKGYFDSYIRTLGV